MSRTEYINDRLFEFRGGMAREFYFINEDYPIIPYYYDPEDDSLHAADSKIPFHFGEGEITTSLIYESLETLKNKLVENFQTERGITLYEYD